MNQRAFIGVWRKWYASQIHVDEKTIKINGRHGKAAKELISHILEAHPENTPCEVLETVLLNWERLDPFYQKNFMELWSINDHWNNIINRIKNATGQEGYEAAIREIQRS